MGMRARLLGRVRAGRARQRHQLMLIRERSVARNGEHRDAAARVIGDHQEFSGRVDRRTNPVAAAGRAPIEHLGKAGLAFEREGGGMIAVAVNRIEKTPAGAERQVGRIHQRADVLDMAPRAGRGVRPIDMNAVAAGLAPGAGE